MTDFDFKKHQEDHAEALQAEASAKERAESLKQEWDVKIEELLKADTGLAELKADMDSATNLFASAKSETSKLRATAKEALETDFIKDLPAGYTQNEGKSIVIPDREQFFRNCVLLGGSDFLTINDKAVQGLTKLASKKGNSWTLDMNATWLFGCELKVAPKAMISDAKLKLIPVVKPESAKQLVQEVVQAPDVRKSQAIPLKEITF